MPFFPVSGNHEMSSEKLIRKWQERVGPLYYHFVYRNVLFLCLDSQDQTPLPADSHPTGISDAQVQYVQKALADNPNVRWTFVFLHQPLWIKSCTKTPSAGTRSQEMLAKRPHTVFAGHTHSYAKFNVGGHSTTSSPPPAAAASLTAPLRASSTRSSGSR